MKIHEYQGKAILKKYGVAVPRGEMAETREQAQAAAKNLFDAGASDCTITIARTRRRSSGGGSDRNARSHMDCDSFARTFQR